MPDTGALSIRDGWYRSYHSAKMWFRTRKEAVAAAEKMRLKKIAALKKQLKKLEEMTFEGGE